MSKRACVVCGARVTNLNPKCVTCDPTCTRARKNGKTREQQFQVEIAQEIENEKFNERFGTNARPVYK